jgi:hypothetical protein
MSEYVLTLWQAITYDPLITLGLFAFNLVLSALVVSGWRTPSRERDRAPLARSTGQESNPCGQTA